MILFTNNDLFTMSVYDGNGRKTPKYTKKRETKEKFPVWLPSHPPSIKLEADCFPGRKNRTYPRWDGNPNIQG